MGTKDSTRALRTLKLSKQGITADKVISTLRMIIKADKTRYEYNGFHAQNKAGEKPAPCERWATPAELATDLLTEITRNPKIIAPPINVPDPRVTNLQKAALDVAWQCNTLHLSSDPTLANRNLARAVSRLEHLAKTGAPT